MTIALIAFDGSENAMRAIDEVLDTMDTSKLHAHLLYVCEPVQVNELIFSQDPVLTMLSINKAHEEAGWTLLASAQARLESAGVAFDAYVRIG
ncbi:MAG: universal stress protein, partial [Nitrosomonas sp.]